MREITKKQFEKLKTSQTFLSAKGNNSILQRIRKLKVGKGLIIPVKEWGPKTPPNQYIPTAFRDSPKIFSTRTFKDRKTIVVFRLK